MTLTLTCSLIGSLQEGSVSVSSILNHPVLLLLLLPVQSEAAAVPSPSASQLPGSTPAAAAAAAAAAGPAAVSTPCWNQARPAPALKLLLKGRLTTTAWLQAQLLWTCKIDRTAGRLQADRLLSTAQS